MVEAKGSFWVQCTDYELISLMTWKKPRPIKVTPLQVAKAKQQAFFWHP